MRRALPLLLTVAAFFIAALMWVGSNRVSGHAFREGSALNTSPAGTSLAYAYLGRRGVVNMLTTPLRSGAVPNNAVVLCDLDHAVCAGRSHYRLRGSNLGEQIAVGQAEEIVPLFEWNDPSVE